MLAFILKDLRVYSNSRRYRTIQFFLLVVLVVIFFIGAVEFYTQSINNSQSNSNIDVGKQIYSLFIISLLIMVFFVPRHAVEAIVMERRQNILDDHQKTVNENEALLMLTSHANWKIFGGKLIGVVVWTIWGIWLTIPLFALSSYIGGYSIWQMGKCMLVLTVTSIFFGLIGIVFAISFRPIHAKTISYGIILSLTFLPLLPIIPFYEFRHFGILSPLKVLQSIIQHNISHLWLLYVCLYCILSILIFPITIKGFNTKKLK